MCARVCMCWRFHKTNYFKKRCVKFLAFKALWSLKSHADNLLLCFVFQGFLFLSSKSFQDGRPAGYLEQPSFWLIFVILWDLPRLLQNAEKFMQTQTSWFTVLSFFFFSHDLYFNCRPRLYMYISLTWSNMLRNHCLNVSPVLSNVWLRREWLMFYTVYSAVCSD